MDDNIKTPHNQYSPKAYNILEDLIYQIFLFTKQQNSRILFQVGRGRGGKCGHGCGGRGCGSGVSRGRDSYNFPPKLVNNLVINTMVLEISI